MIQAEAQAPALPVVAVESHARRRLKRYWLPILGAAVVAAWAVVIVLGPAIAPYGPTAVDLTARLQPPSAAHLFGTDDLGRDVFSRVLLGARLSLPTGLAVVLIGGFLGIGVGAVAAYAGGKVEEALMRTADVVLAFPPLILAMAIAAARGVGVGNAVLSLVAIWWPQYARLSRSLILVQRDQEYVHAARALGHGPARTLLRHILPNTAGPIVALLTLDVGNAIITFSSLSFLGLGAVPPTPEWGAMVSAGRLLITQWWVSGMPGLAILSVVLAFNFLGDGLRDWLDPRARQR
ncbi:MAG TPA: ABC transporter permease [Candidatus Methylomirabilis sp.]|nr:ABC transporter permease [Candidatus Methylomirabilis sp.]